MAIPLIIGGIALGSAIFGAKKGIDAKKNYAEAKNIVEEAMNDFNDAKDSMNHVRLETSSDLVKLGKARLVYEGDLMKRFVIALSKVNKVSYKPISIGGTNVQIDEPQLQEISLAAYKASDLLKDGVGAVSSGILAGIGASGLSSHRKFIVNSVP